MTEKGGGGIGMLRDRLAHGWNAFWAADNARADSGSRGYSSSGIGRPSRTRFSFTNERSIISSIYTRIGIDVAAVEMRHVQLDEQRRYLNDRDSGLNYCLTIGANIDQPARAFRQDIAMSLFDYGTIAVVPVDTDISPDQTASFDIKSMRVGPITQWMSDKVRVKLWNEAKATYQEVEVPKTFAAVVENPLYAVMNETSSTLQRLVQKLNLLDKVDDEQASGKLDLIIQLPYAIKGDAKRQQAEQRRQDLEFQLAGSKYGIGYTDGTEKITQLNRPVENNLLQQIKDLKDQLYAELGVTPEVMNGTADEATMLNYQNRTIIPILDAVVESMRRTFLTKTALTQRQWIMYFRDPFKLVPISQIADIVDKLGRNEVASSNEMRGWVGLPPSKDKGADELKNSNMPDKSKAGEPATVDGTAVEDDQRVIEQKTTG